MSVKVRNDVQDIGALEAGGEELTLLGRHLAALPLPPRVGKLLLYGVLFRCLDPVLTVACAMAYRYCRCHPVLTATVVTLPLPISYAKMPLKCHPVR